MILIDGIECISEKEASNRFGYSQSWFRNERYKRSGPIFIKIRRGKILYPLKNIESWFRINIHFSE